MGIADIFGRLRREAGLVLRPSTPPRRIAPTIRTLHAESEIILSWAQAGAIVFFAALYLAAPKALGAKGMLEPVPLVLLVYAPLVAGRIWLAHRRLMTPPLVVGSMLIDVAVLYGLIWSFHIQYGQPAAFYLKAPTFLYVFLIIALRALRLEPWSLLLMGGLAIAGWTAMLLYALYGGASPGVVTRDYAVYLTSSTILVGAEIDKMVTLAGVTLVLAYAVARARELLHSSVRAATAVGDLSRFFGRNLAQRIIGAEDEVAAGQAERREAAMVFFDLRGFSAMAETEDPADILALLRDMHAFLVPTVRAHKGIVDKFLGDGCLASFGAIEPDPQYAANALRAAEAVLAAAEDWAQRRGAAGQAALRLGCAVASGPVLFGVIGFADRLEYTVIGDAVNVAAKLEKHTKVERVAGLTTAATFALAQAQGFTPPRETRRAARVARLSAPVDLVVLVPATVNAGA